MTDFSSTEQRIAVTCTRFPSFPRRPVTLARLITHLHKQMHDRSNAVLKPHGVNYSEYSLLMMLYGSASGTMSPSELAEAAGEKSANITRLTNELCGKGLIDRSASVDDRRKLVLSLTAQGVALIESFLPEVGELVQRQTEVLSAPEQAQLESLLKKYLSGMAD